MFLTIILIALTGTIVGMGLPTAASYIVLAILAAPSLVSLGVPNVQAHLLCFWLALTSNITPPVCVAAFAAASVSKGNPMKTGLHACTLGLFLYMIPFAFVYAPQVMLIGGNLTEILAVIASFILATIGLSAAIQGWLLRELSIWERLAYLASSVLLIMPKTLTDVAGLGILLLMILLSYKKVKSARLLEKQPGF